MWNAKERGRQVPLRPFKKSCVHLIRHAIQQHVHLESWERASPNPFKPTSTSPPTFSIPPLLTKARNRRAKHTEAQAAPHSTPTWLSQPVQRKAKSSGIVQKDDLKHRTFVDASVAKARPRGPITKSCHEMKRFSHHNSTLGSARPSSSEKHQNSNTITSSRTFSSSY